MNFIDILLMLAIAATVFFAVRHAVRTRRSGGCGCGCAGCDKACARRDAGARPPER